MAAKNPVKNKFAKNKKKRTQKVHLVFDEAKRREFLTGFHKRKLQRKKEAKEKFERDLKEERKRLKNEAKQSFQKLVASHRPIPELDSFLQEEYQDGDATVRVVELSTDPYPNSNMEIKMESEESKDPKTEEEDEVPGMSLTRNANFTSKKDVKRLLKKEATKKLQKSKVFQLKNKMEKSKQRKKAEKGRKEQMKRDKKSKKHNKR